MNWHMGGYALYVWSSYGIVLVTLAIMAWKTIKQHQQILKQIRKISQGLA